MRKERNTPASRDKLAGAREGNEYNHNTGFKYSRQVTIGELLGHGQSEAISRNDLVSITGVNPREVTREIERERRQGVPILSNGNGYYLPNDDDEVKSCVHSLLNRANEIRLTAKAIEKGAGLYG